MKKDIPMTDPKQNPKNWPEAIAGMVSNLCQATTFIAIIIGLVKCGSK